MDENELKLTMPEETSGVVTLVDWLTGPDGQAYKAVWCKEWRIFTDQEFGKIGDIMGSWSNMTDRFTLVGYDSQGATAIAIPGCKVFAWCAGNSSQCSNKTNVFVY